MIESVILKAGFIIVAAIGFLLLNSDKFGVVVKNYKRLTAHKKNSENQVSNN